MTKIDAASAATAKPCPDAAGSFKAEATETAITVENVRTRLQMILDELLAEHVKAAEIESYQVADQVSQLSAIIMGLSDVQSFVDRATNAFPDDVNLKEIFKLPQLADSSGMTLEEVEALVVGFSGQKYEFVVLPWLVKELYRDRQSVGPILKAHAEAQKPRTIEQIDLEMTRLKAERLTLQAEAMGDFSLSKDRTSAFTATKVPVESVVSELERFFQLYNVWWEALGIKVTKLSPEAVAERKLAGRLSGKRYDGTGRLTIRKDDMAIDIEGSLDFIASVRAQLDAENS